MARTIIAEGLGKLYPLGQRGATYSTIREALARRRVPTGKPEHAKVWALRSVSFSVDEGETIGVVGRNGAGKTTLLKILARITEPTTGSARTRGRVGALLAVGTGFHPELTGRENVFLSGAVLGVSRRDVARRFDEIVAF